MRKLAPPERFSYDFAHAAGSGGRLRAAGDYRGLRRACRSAPNVVDDDRNDGPPGLLHTGEPGLVLQHLALPACHSTLSYSAATRHPARRSPPASGRRRSRESCTAIPATEAHGRSSPAGLHFPSPTPHVHPRTAAACVRQRCRGGRADHERPARVRPRCTTASATRHRAWQEPVARNCRATSTAVHGAVASLFRHQSGRCAHPLVDHRWWSTASPPGRGCESRWCSRCRSRIGRCSAHRRNGFAARDDVQCGQLAYQVRFTARINPVPRAPSRRWPPARRVAAG